jgi:hypothetical protein
MQTSSGALSRSNTASLFQETLSCQLDIRSPFLLDQSLLKVPVFERMIQVANTKVYSFALGFLPLLPEPEAALLIPRMRLAQRLYIRGEREASSMQENESYPGSRVPL